MARDFHHLWKSGKSLQWRHNERDGLTIVYSTIYSGTDQRKHQMSASLAFMWRIHWWPVNFPHKVTRKTFPSDDVIMATLSCQLSSSLACMLLIDWAIILTALWLDHKMKLSQNLNRKKNWSGNTCVHQYIASLSLWCGFDEVMTFHYVR